MIRRYVEQHEPVTATLCFLSKKDMCLSDDEVFKLTTTVEALEPFELATTEMSSESQVTLSKMIPVINMLHRSLYGLSQRKFPLAVLLQSHLRKRFTQLEDTYFVAASTILNPCFKRLPFSEGATKKTETRLLSLIRDKQGERSDQILQTPGPSSVSAAETEPPAKKSLWEAFDVQADEHRQTSLPQASATVQLNRYFEMPLAKRGVDNPLTWWSQHEKAFPELSQEAKKLLAIPATSVPSERLFSKAGELISSKRTCLGEKHVDKLLFLNKNLKSLAPSVPVQHK